MPQLPKATIGNTLSDEDALYVIAKLSSGKACGPDGIPNEDYKNVPACKHTLTKLLQRILEDMDVPTEFAKAVFVML